MRTAIGQLRQMHPRVQVLAMVIAAFAVLGDFAMIRSGPAQWTVEGRWVLAVLLLVVNVRLFQGDWLALGLRLSPVQGWWYWIKGALIIGAIVLACVVFGLVAMLMLDWHIPLYSTPPYEVAAAFGRMCVFAPVLEETIYRLVLCVAFMHWLRPWGTIALSGLVFAGLHWAYGNPSPENLVGGFFLAWCFVKSESIVVPVLLHGLGNLFALAAQVGAWYWIREVV